MSRFGFPRLVDVPKKGYQQKCDDEVVADTAKIGVYASGLISKGIATIVHAWAAESDWEDCGRRLA
jgi:hypothetical protein